MALGGCYTCIKYLMFAFNFLFWLIGIALLSVGVWIKVNNQSFSSVTTDLNSTEINEFVSQLQSTISSDYVYILLIVISVLIMLIGFLGCCGAIRESQCLLGLFFFCLLVIFSMIIGVGVYTYASEGKPKDMVSKLLNKQVTAAKANNVEASEFMKLIQFKFKCCGADKGSLDYEGHSPNNCLIENFSKPCTAIMIATAKDNEKLIGGILIGISFLLLMGLLFSLMLCCGIKEQAAL